MLKSSIDEIELATVKQRTERLMEIEPETRNSDSLLIQRYMKVYHGIDINIAPEMPSFETVRRSRQRIQADGRCLPVGDVAEVRKENQVVFSNFFKN